MLQRPQLGILGGSWRKVWICLNTPDHTLEFEKLWIQCLRAAFRARM